MVYSCIQNNLTIILKSFGWLPTNRWTVNWLSINYWFKLSCNNVFRCNNNVRQMWIKLVVDPPTIQWSIYWFSFLLHLFFLAVASITVDNFNNDFTLAEGEVWHWFVFSETKQNLTLVFLFGVLLTSKNCTVQFFVVSDWPHFDQLDQYL